MSLATQDSSFIPPSLHIPASTAVMNVSIIDSTGDIVGPSGSSVMPTIPGQETFGFKTFCFLLEHAESSQRLLFDGGLRTDWWNLSPGNVQGTEEDMPGLKVTKNINEILRDGGVDDQTISAVIWSHHHFDHIGDASLFPSSTNIVVGPGFKENFMPGYPTDPDAIMLDSDFEGRVVHEIDFDTNQTTIGGLRAFDYFGDGAMYLLDTPGHAPGHISALVRTTPDTFVLLGGDVCDAPQVMRPTSNNPLPERFNPRLPSPCPCTHATATIADKDRGRTKPFSLVSQFEISFYEDPETSQTSVDQLTDFDADPNVFVALAHDRSLAEVLDFFPGKTINDWKARDWKEAAMWGFLHDLPVDGKAPHNGLLVDGLYRDNVKVRSVEDVLRTLDPNEIGRCSNTSST